MNFLRNFLKDLSPVEWIIIGVVAMLVTGVFVIESRSANEHERLMQQCLEDGKKEYECAALLKRDRSSTTIVIPSS
jgi:hypothetical protein